MAATTRARRSWAAGLVIAAWLAQARAKGDVPPVGDARALARVMTSGAAPGAATSATPDGATAVAALLGDHMVLPLVDGQATLRGQARSNELVTATLGGRVAHARANAQGRWTLTWAASGVDPGLAKGKPPRPLTLRLGGPTGRVAKDVVLGEIWLAAGQSNMAMPVIQAQGAEALAADAVAASLRFFRIDNDTEGDLSAIHGQWVRATVGEAARFSAVAASFGVALRRQRTHAIGLVQAAWNATPLASWIRDDAWAAAGHAELRPPWPPPPSADEVKAYETKRAAWMKAARYQDGDNEGSAHGWSGAAFDDRGWAIEAVPGAWDAQGKAGFDGVVWYRTRASLPSPCRGRALELSLGPIDDCDRTFVNGKLVGATCHETENPYRVPRHYRVPASLAARELSLAVRVVDEIGDGGFTGLAAEMEVACTTSRGALTVPLAGPWRVAVEKEASRDRPGPAAAPTPPAGWPSPFMPGALARGWLSHLAAFPFEGVLWYQGENNLGQAQTYAASLEVWLADWCRLFARADLPVLIVQLPGHARPNHALGTAERPWAEIREAQRALAHHAKANVRLAITTDLGQGASIHPTLKRPIGERLAWLALHPQAPATGPWLVAATRASDAAVLSFATTGKLRVKAPALPQDGSAPAPEKSAIPTARDVNVVGFRVVDGSGKETHALAHVEGDKVIVTWEPGIDVRAILYGWDDDPLGPLPEGELPDGTLTDDTGWPASPFRTTIERAAARP